jgi:hypothetical protein
MKTRLTMTRDEANDLIYDLIEAVRLRESDQGRFIQHHNEVDRLSNLIADAMCGALNAEE